MNSTLHHMKRNVRLAEVAFLAAGAAAAALLFPRARGKVHLRKARPILQTPTKEAFPAQDGRPVIILPGNGQLLCEASRNFGRALSQHRLFNLNGQVAIADNTTGLLRTCSAGEFIELAEQFTVPARLKDHATAQPQSLTTNAAAAILGSQHFRKELPTVTRCHALPLPVLVGDNAVTLARLGYDPQTGVFTAGTLTYNADASVPDAREFFHQLLAGFPFADRETSKSGVIAAALTLFCQNLWSEGTTWPAFLYLANQPGAGKSLLATLPMTAVLGRIAATAKPKDDDEMRKMLFAAALERQPVVYLDNIVGALRSPSLESFLTASTIAGRILGKSRTVAVQKSTVVLITGNGCELGPDMQQRTVTIQLDVPQAGAREIKTHLDEQRLLELRPQVLRALYAFVREWAEGGCPKPSRLHQRFPRWSEVVGGILEFNGYALPY